MGCPDGAVSGVGIDPSFERFQFLPQVRCVEGVEVHGRRGRGGGGELSGGGQNRMTGRGHSRHSGGASEMNNGDFRTRGKRGRVGGEVGDRRGRGGGWRGKGVEEGGRMLRGGGGGEGGVIGEGWGRWWSAYAVDASQNGLEFCRRGMRSGRDWRRRRSGGGGDEGRRGGRIHERDTRQEKRKRDTFTTNVKREK